MHRVRCLRRHLSDGLHHLYGEWRGIRASHPADRAVGACDDSGPLCFGIAEDKPDHGQGRGPLPALRSMRGTLPNRCVGHEEVPLRDDEGRMPWPGRSGARVTCILDIDLATVEKLIQQQYASKQQLLDSNIKAVHMGYDYAREHLSGICGLKVAKSDAVGNRIFVNGNDAAALGCVYGGATIAAWYPITPSTSLAESFMKYCRKLRVDPETKKNKFAIIQSEDEISAIGSVIGAGWNGARAFTATSGPGISLMQEFLGLAY